MRTFFHIKANTYFLEIILLMCFSVSCDYLIPPPTGQGAPPYHPGSDGSVPSLPSVPSLCEAPKKGVVKCTPHYSIAHFNQQVKGFLSTTSDPSTLENVGCLKEHCERGSWFHMTGVVVFENGGKLNPFALNQVLQVSTRSKIAVLIKPFNRQEFKLELPAAAIAGQVNGNVATLTFEDEKGKVTLDGEIRSSANNVNTMVFSAPFRYENFTHFAGLNTGYEGTIGMLEIEACDFFDCGG